MLWLFRIIQCYVRGKDKRELDILFSKAWSKMSSIFMKYVCCHPSSRAVSQSSVIKNCLCDFTWNSLVWMYHHVHISPEAWKVNMSVVDVSAGPLNNVCLLCMLKFSSLGITGNLMHHH